MQTAAKLLIEPILIVCEGRRIWNPMRMGTGRSGARRTQFRKYMGYFVKAIRMSLMPT